MNYLQSTLNWLGIGIEYVVAAALIVGGLYLATLFNLAATNPLYWILRPLRWAGIGIALFGFGMASISYGKTIGAVDCNRRWQQANLEARLAQAKQEAEAKQLAVDVANAEAKNLERANEDLAKQIVDYQVAVDHMAGTIEDCRRASADDDRRLQQLTRTGPKGGKPPAAGRKAR